MQVYNIMVHYVCILLLVFGLDGVVAQVDTLVEIIYLEGLGAKSEHSLCDIKL